MTNSERRVQRVRKALDPPGEARDDIWIIARARRRLGFDWGEPTAEEAWERAALALADAPRHELRAARGARRHPVALPGRGAPRLAVPARAAVGRAASRARPRRSAPSSTSRRSRRSTPSTRSGSRPGRRLESYNTGVQSNCYRSPLHRGESLDISPEDAERLVLEEGEIVRVSSRRGSVEAPVRIDPSLRPGLAFMTFHFPDQVDTNVLTIDATDPKSRHCRVQGCAVRVDKLSRRPSSRSAARRRGGAARRSPDD